MSIISIHSERVIPQFDLGDRLRKALQVNGVSVEDIAAELEVTRFTVSNWMSGRTKPSKAAIRFWSELTGVDYQWLLTGKSPDKPGPSGLYTPRDSNPEPTGYGSNVTVLHSTRLTERSAA